MDSNGPYLGESAHTASAGSLWRIVNLFRGRASQNDSTIQEMVRIEDIRDLKLGVPKALGDLCATGLLQKGTENSPEDIPVAILMDEHDELDSPNPPSHLHPLMIQKSTVSNAFKFLTLDLLNHRHRIEQIENLSGSESKELERGNTLSVKLEI